MTRRNTFGCVCYVTMFLSQCLLQSVMAAEKEMFTCDYVDDDYKILRVRCRNHCSTGNSLMNIKIYDVTSMKAMAVFIRGKLPFAFMPPLPEISYYVGGCVPGEESSCHLELLITNVDLLAQLHFGCILTCIDNRGALITDSSSTRVDQKEMFTYEFLDKGSNILRLRCNKDCSTGYTPRSIAIYNSTSQQIIAVLNAGKIPITVKLPQQEMTFYVGGLLEEDSCYLELLITNFNPKTHLEVECDIVRVDIFGIARTVSSQLIIDTTVPQGSGQRVSITIVIALIVVIVLLLLLAICFAFMWRRAVYSKQSSAVSAVTLSYAAPQDAIVTDLRDDGDVTSANIEN